MNNQTELTTLLADLVRIDSVNPDLIAGAKGEADVAAFIAHWAAQAGLEVMLQEVAPGRSNVIVIAKGTGGGQNLMLNGHIDTVGLTDMEEPFSARLEGNKMYGRGVYDMKSGVAASLITAKRAQALSLRGDVIVTCVVDEEVASLGTQAICRELPRWRPDAVIVTEPTEMEIAVAHRGFIWFDIETFGVAAHGSRPHLGVDAIAKMGPVLVGLAQHDHELRAHPTHPHVGSGSIHASLIQGGQELSSYPAYSKLQVERRTIPGESPDVVEAQLRAILDRCARSDPAFKARLTRGLVREAFEVDENTTLVQLCHQHLTRVTGQPAKIGGVSFWADFGAHGAVEWVEMNTVHQCAEVYTAIAQAFCG